MANRFWVGGGSSANWNATVNTNWSATSGGANNASVPGSADDVFFDANSGAGTSTISNSITVLSVDCTGYVGTLVQNASTTLAIVGNKFKLVAGMTFTATAATSIIGFTATTGTTLLTSAGKTLGTVQLQANGCSVQLQDDLTVRSDGAIQLNFNLTCTFDANNKNVTTGTFNSTGTLARTVTMGSGTWTLTGTGSNVWSVVSTNLTFNIGGPIVIPDTAVVGGTRIFSGGGLTYGDISFGNNTSGAQTQINGANTFANVTVRGPNLIAASAGVTQTVSGTLTVQDNVQLASTSQSSAATISKASGAVVCKNCAFRTMAFTGGAAFRAQDSIDLGGNTGITIVPPGPSPSSNIGI